MLCLFVRFVATFGIEVGYGYVAMACLVACVYQAHGVNAIAYARILQAVELKPVIPMQGLAHLFPLQAKVVDVGLLWAWAQIVTEQIEAFSRGPLPHP